MSKRPARKPKKETAPTAREDNPHWLTTDPTGAPPPPPIKTKKGSLPLSDIEWPDFERLCRRLALLSGSVETAYVYGGPGHAQQGIDILVRMLDGSFEVWQSKRYQKFKAADVNAAVDLFLEHEWAEKAKRLVLAVTSDFSDPKIIDAISIAAAKLKENGIAFDAQDQSLLTETLRVQPILVDDFFGRPWVEAVCGSEAAESLKDRFSRFDIDAVRNRLRDLYTAWIAAVDPGLPISGPDKDGRPIPAPKLSQRYVLPDLLLSVSGIEQEPDPSPPQQAGNAEDPRFQASDTRRADQGRPSRLSPTRSRDRVLSVDQFLATERRAVIKAEAGAGKTTLLRFLALEVLSDAPGIDSVRHNFAGYIPVWVPFALWARMAEGKDHPPPLEEVVHAFVSAQNDVALADDVKRALGTQKIVLLVDGLDEARGDTLPDTVLAGLTTFAEMRNVPVICTSRPHGLHALSGLGATWTELRLAPLSDIKRDELALLWYRILERSELGANTAAEAVESQAQRRAKQFTAALLRNPGIARLSQTPLFLVALLKLHRLGRDLPRNRYAASKEIVDQLLEHQPKRRAKDAVETRMGRPDTRDRDRVLHDFAYALHTGELRGAVADGAGEDDAVSRAAQIVLSRRNDGNLEAAEVVARSFFSFGEESAGLLVKKARNNIGFLHRSLQEFLVARKLEQLKLSDKLEFVRGHASHADWREPILYLLSLTANEQEAGQLLEAIEQAPAPGITEHSSRDSLLTEAVFADFAHDLPIVRRLAERLFSHAESFAWGNSQRQLLTSVTDGLFSQSVSDLCAEKLNEWTPDFHGYGRAGAIQQMLNWDKALRPICIPYLLRTIAGESEYVWRSAGQVLAEFESGNQDTKAALLKLLHTPRSVDTLNAALFALGRGWSADKDVGEIAQVLRDSSEPGIRVDAIRIRAARREADLSDLEIIGPLSFKKEHFGGEIFARDLIEYFAQHYKPEFIGLIETALRGASGPHSQMPLIGSLLLVDPSHPLVTPTLIQILQKDWAVGQVFAPSNFPIKNIVWTPELTALIEGYLAKERFFEYETYWISKSLKAPFVKTKMLESLVEPNSLAFWSSRGLLEGWGKDDPEVSTIFQSFMDGPVAKLSYVAEELPAVIDDKAAVRKALLRGLAALPHRSQFLVAGMRELGVTADDEEAFQACLNASLTPNSMYDDLWRKEMIQVFPSRPEIRELAIAEIERRDGNIAMVSQSYGDDKDMCTRILKVIAPLPAPNRQTLLSQFELAAQSSDVAFDLLERSRQDTDGAACGTAIMGWAEACIASGTLWPDRLAYLEKQLQAVGPEYDHRRAAGLIGLGMADKLGAFVGLKDYQGRPESIKIGAVSLLRDDDDRYLRRMLPLWDRFSAVLGGDTEIIQRLGFSAQTCLSVLNPGVSNAKRLFDLLIGSVPATMHVRMHDHIGVVARFEPDGPVMRDLIMPILTSNEYGHSNADTWAEMMAADVFADHFSLVPALLADVMNAFSADPTRSTAAAALAEVTLRRSEPELVKLLKEKAAGQNYDVTSGFKVMAAISSPDTIIDNIFWLLEDNVERIFWNCAYWVPTLLRRIERDPDVGDAMIAALDRASSYSQRISLLAVAGRGSQGRIKHHAVFLREEDIASKAVAPPIGFDVTSGTNRVVLHVLHELLI